MVLMQLYPDSRAFFMGKGYFMSRQNWQKH